MRPQRQQNQQCRAGNLVARRSCWYGKCSEGGHELEPGCRGRKRQDWKRLTAEEDAGKPGEANRDRLKKRVGSVPRRRRRLGTGGLGSNLPLKRPTGHPGRLTSSETIQGWAGDEGGGVAVAV